MYVDNLSSECAESRKLGYNSTSGLHQTRDTTLRHLRQTSLNNRDSLSNSRSIKDKIQYLSQIHRKIDTELVAKQVNEYQIQNYDEQNN